MIVHVKFLLNISLSPLNIKQYLKTRMHSSRMPSGCLGCLPEGVCKGGCLPRWAGVPHWPRGKHPIASFTMLVLTACCPTSISKFKSHDFCFRKRGLHPQSYNFPLKWPRDDFSRHKAALSTPAIFRKKSYWNRRENIQFLHHQYFQTTSPTPPRRGQNDRSLWKHYLSATNVTDGYYLTDAHHQNFSHNNYRKCLNCPLNWVFRNKKFCQMRQL